MRNFYSPLRYPGGKTRIAPFVKELIYENRLVGINYIEPYAGGAGVALTLLFEEYVSKITINDYDPSIYAFWYSIVNYTDAFCEKVSKTPINMDSWFEQKEIQTGRLKQSDFFELGFSTFFLNRTNISGVIKGGVIGGKNQRGKYKIDARFNKDKLLEKIKQIGNYKNKIDVTNEDAKHILQKRLDGCFMYIDPPYVSKGRKLYMNFYQKNDHRDISKALLDNDSNCFWILSYDANDLIRTLYANCKNKISWNLNYGTSNRMGEEDIFLHPKLKFKKALSAL